MIVTAVETRRRSGKVDVYVDGELAVTMARELAAQRDLYPGRTLVPAELGALQDEAARSGAIEAALRLLSYRPRSEQELRERLYRKGYRSGVVRAALTRMRELGYLDDGAFARFWTETRRAAHPSSQRLLQGELRRRGIDRETAEEATAGLSDEEAAYEAARRRLRGLAGLAYQGFRERLGAFLTRRGFTYEVARKTIDRCWEELEAERAQQGDAQADA